MIIINFSRENALIFASILKVGSVKYEKMKEVRKVSGVGFRIQVRLSR